MIDAVVFDVDGVLVRDGEFNRILNEDYGFTRDQTSAFFGGPFKECVLGRADLKEAIAPFLRDWGWQGSVDDCLRMWFEADAELNQEMLDVAVRLCGAGRRCYVASTQEAHRADYLERVLGLGAKFDGLFFSCRVGSSKPDPAFFRFVEEQIETDTARVLLFDDRPANVEGARAVGWNAELYTFGEDIEDLLARHGLETSR